VRVIIQRVKEASVKVNGNSFNSISQGLLVFLGIEESDSQEDIEWLVSKIIRLRIFSDDKDKMNLSVNDIKGEILVVSQFTLHASTRKGNRPSFIKAAKPEVAIPLYEEFINKLKSVFNGTLNTGEFGADMEIFLINDGPVTIFIDSKSKE
jgi:D-tyrosyl-tRNA(Tyr) deacylase